MSNSPHRATGRVARTPLAAAATAALQSTTPDTDASTSANEPLASPAVELAATQDNGDRLTFDGVLNDWAEQLSREQLNCALALGTSLLHSTEKLAEVQVEFSRQAQQGFAQMKRQLQDAHGLADLGAVQTGLLQADWEAFSRSSLRLAELGAASLAQIWQEGSNGQTRMGCALWKSAMDWMRLQSTLPAHADILEAEVEHVLSPVTASPLVWPAQEAARQAALMAANGWNGWLLWSGHAANAGRDFFSAPARSH